MKKVVTVALLLLALAILPAEAQSFGDLFAVTNTRYRPASATPRLATNGRDFFLFWIADQKVRATRLRDGEARAGHVVIDIMHSYDVAWTGERFLAVYSRQTPGTVRNDIMGQLLDADARPLGAPFTIAGNGHNPRIAARGDSAMLLYEDQNRQLRVQLLRADGRSSGAQSRIVWPAGLSHAIAASDSGFAMVTSNGTDVRPITFDANGQTIAERALDRPNLFRTVTIASDGDRYLVVWCDEEEAAAVTLDANATFGPRLLIDDGSSSQPSSQTSKPTAVWNGAGWSVSYELYAGISARTRVAHLDFAATRVVSRDDSADGTRDPSVAVLANRIMTTWSPLAGGGAAVAELPLSANAARTATYAATRQVLLATASSNDATLIVWMEISAERASIRTGTRRHDGGWTERELVNGPGQVIAASDGTHFAVVVTNAQGSELIRLDENGTPLPSRLKLPEQPTVMAWNGKHYAVISVWTAKGILITQSGQLAKQVDIPNLTFEPESIASDGKGFFIAGTRAECQFLLCFPVSVHGLRLGAELQAIDPEPITFSPEDGRLAGTAWNGSEYVVVWTDERTRIARVPSSPATPIETISTNVQLLTSNAMAVMTDGTIAIHSPMYNSTPVSRVAFVRPNGTTAQVVDVAGTTFLTGPTPLAPLPNGALAYITSNIQDAAPHHGTSHVMMAIARPTPLARPTPPYVSVKLDESHVRAEWSGASGAINGYRVEYRVDDGSWNELEDWFGPGAHSASIRRPSFGTTFAIRVRALNDAGASAYSATALTQPGRRRAVR